MAELRLKSTGTLKLFENDNTSSVTIASPASLGADRTITLPDASVTLASGTMLATDGSGASLTALNATQLTSGKVPTAQLGTGTASSSTILYGDQTYKTEPAAGGITEADCWRLTGDPYTMSASINTWTLISTDWARATGDGFGLLGTGLTQSSGIFSFPSTGFWLISYTFVNNANAGASNTFNMSMHTTLNNADYAEATYDYASTASTYFTNSLTQEFLFDVTNTTNCKFKFFYYTGVQNNLLMGEGGVSTTRISAFRMADT